MFNVILKLSVRVDAAGSSNRYAQSESSVF